VFYFLEGETNHPVCAKRVKSGKENIELFANLPTCKICRQPFFGAVLLFLRWLTEKNADFVLKNNFPKNQPYPIVVDS
jgi:hypothetical protein